ncbi:MAG: radical SAM protein, partial [Deltaproteobacteria bacterium]|nr:radical SAM protein [Deltaproteobacteria bacterium]
MSSKLIAKAKRLLAEEWRVFPEDRGALAPGQKGRLSVALAFPNRYYTAMSNLGFQTVFRLLNQQAETSCERVFLPDPEDIEEYQRTETPLFSLESQRSLRSFDALAFSISYENDFPFLLQMLEMGKISIRREERTPSDPLIIAGGAPILMNPEPLADFVDLFVIGEAEDLVAPLAATLLQAKEKGWSRERLLAGLAEIEGMYVPGFYEVHYHPDGTIAAFEPRGDCPRTIKRIWLPDLNSSLTVSSVLTPHTELSSMFLVELSRGCPRGCRFCAGCYAYFPYRLRRPALLTEALRG